MSGEVGTPGAMVDHRVIADAELALLGVLSSGHLLGGPVPAPDARPAGTAAAGHPVSVGLLVSTGVAQQAVEAGACELLDEESTPVAVLTQPSIGAGQAPGSVLLSGGLGARRTRESGGTRGNVLTAADLPDPNLRAGDTSGLLLVVLRRPLIGAERDRVVEHLATGRPALVVLPDAGDGSDVPVDVLLAVAQRIASAEVDGQAMRVRAAPLAWRDADSDRNLVSALARRCGAVEVLDLQTTDESAGAVAWRDVLRGLAEDDPTALERLDPQAVPLLARWRPPRSRRGLVVMFTGLSGSGKSTLARDVARRITAESDRAVSLLDGDVVRRMLSSELGFDKASRDLNVRRIGFVAAEVAKHGGTALCAPIAPYAATRAAVRRMVEAQGDFVLVHVNTPIEECERRDLKGLYAKARAGLIPEFTGVSDPYETPTDAELAVDTSTIPRTEAADMVLRHLRLGDWLPAHDAMTTMEGSP